jgi:hypothetical protein
MIQQTTTKGGTITFDAPDWRAGLGPMGKFGSSPSGNKLVVNGFQRIESVDPFMSYGSIGPGFAPSASATNSSGLAGTLTSFVVKDSSNAYGIDTGGKVHSVDYTTATGVINASPHTITGTSPVGQDTIIYRRRSASTPTYTTSLFYSYYNNANWDVGCITDATVAWGSATFDDDFMSTVPTNPLDVSSGDGDDANQKTAPHPMCVGADDLLYIGAGRYLHAYDGDIGTQGQFYSKVLTLPAGSQIVAVRKYQDLLLIAVNYYSTGSSTGVGEALVYVWNYTDADPNQVIPLEDNYVSSLFLWRGSPTVVTSGITERNGTIKVKVISGTTVTKIADWDGIIPVLRGVVVANDVLYLNCGGEIVSVGDRYIKSNAVNHIGTLRNAGVSGGLFYDPASSSLVLWGGTSASTTYSFTGLGLNGLGAGECGTFSVFPPFPVGKIGKISSVVVEYTKPLAANANNGQLTLLIKVNSGETTAIIENAKASVTSPLTRKYSVTTAGANLPQFTSLELFMSWATSSSASAPIVSRVTIEYDHVDVAQN